MGTDSKYLDSQLKVQIDACKIKKEIIEELSMEKIYLDFSKVQAIVQMLVDMSCEINLGIYHLCYYTDSYYAFYDSRAILFWFENYNVIWNIDTMDVKVEKEVNGCKVLVTNTINNNYKCDVADPNVFYHAGDTVKFANKLNEVVRSSGNYIADSLRKNKVTAKEIETGKKVYKYVVTYRSKPFYCEETGHYITLETGCYKWVEE